MKAIQIVMKGDERSEEYAAISRKSFERALDDGVITSIQTFDAITPNSENFEEHVGRYNWQQSLMYADLKNKAPDDHSPTEKAGMCSHWELMRLQSEQKEKFWIMEHDTYMLDERYEVFKTMVNHAQGTLYSNIGLFMGMYCLDRRAAHWMYHMLTNVQFPINCGPYCTLQRLYRTFTTDHLERDDIDFFGIRDPAVHPWTGCDTLGVGRHIGEYYNNHDKGRNGIPNPTTQVISKRLCVTQEHHGYSDEDIEKPWNRHRLFKVID